MGLLADTERGDAPILREAQGQVSNGTPHIETKVLHRWRRHKVELNHKQRARVWSRPLNALVMYKLKTEEQASLRFNEQKKSLCAFMIGYFLTAGVASIATKKPASSFQYLLLFKYKVCSYVCCCRLHLVGLKPDYFLFNLYNLFARLCQFIVVWLTFCGFIGFVSLGSVFLLLFRQLDQILQKNKLMFSCAKKKKKKTVGGTKKKKKKKKKKS